MKKITRLNQLKDSKMFGEKILTRFFSGYSKVALLSIHILLAVSLLVAIVISYQIEYLMVPSDWSLRKCDSVNQFFIGVTCSYIAAYIFWIITTVLPAYNKSVSVAGTLNNRFDEIKKSVRDITFEFAYSTQFKNYFEESDCRGAMNSKNWDSIIPSFQSIYSQDIVFWRFVQAKGEHIRNLVDSFLKSYADELSPEQKVALEAIKNAKIFGILSSFSGLNIDVDGGRLCLVDYYWEMVKSVNNAKLLFEK